MNENKLRLLNLIRLKDEQTLKTNLLDCGYFILELHGESVSDKQTFFNQCMLDFPAMLIKPTNWSSFDDSFSTMIFELDKPKIALVWKNSDAIMRCRLSDFLIVADILTQISRMTSSQDVTFITFLLGEGANFPALVP